MSWGNTRWRVKCLNCGWKGVRTSIQCECYDEWAMYCRPGSPGPGCPSGIVWSCPRCGEVAPGTWAKPEGPIANRFGSYVRVMGEVRPRGRKTIGLADLGVEEPPPAKQEPGFGYHETGDHRWTAGS